MIKYDPNLVSIQIVRLKTVTTALGGSITIVDDKKSSDTLEVIKRVECPLSIARAFIQRHKKVTKYLVPVLTAIVRYDDKIISLERHPLGTFGQLEGEGLNDQIVTWTPDSELNLSKYVNEFITNSNKEWYFDGRYIYSFNNQDINLMLNDAQRMSNDGFFRKLDVTSIDTQVLSQSDKLEPSNRTCVAFVSSNGQYSISPPIWKDVSSVGNTKMDDDTNLTYNFDAIDERMSVNLNFALSAGKQIGELFGYDSIQPLQLPRLMIELHTVNLPNVQQQVKATYDIGLSFTHTFAWLLGLLNQSNNLDTFIAMRSLMKYLTKRGIFRKDSFRQKNIFQEHKSIHDIEVRPIQEIIDENDFSKLSLGSIINKAKSKQRSNNNSPSEGLQIISGLMSE